MPRLHWSPRSPYVRKVMVALHEKGLIDRMEIVRTLADPILPPTSFFSINPLAKIPTLELDEGPSLFDSRVILEWADLEGADGPVLFPTDPRQRLITLRDEAFGTGMIEIAYALLIELYLRPKEQQDSRIIDANRHKFRMVLDHAENYVPQLEERPFDAGHLAIGVALSYFDFRFSDQEWRRDRPRLSAWHCAFSERESVRATAFRDDPRPAT